MMVMVMTEITRDNNGSLSDSSFDVESEENVDRRRGQASPSAAGASRLANSPHQHRRDAGAVGGPRARHGPPATSYSSRGHQQHDSRRHHRSAAADPDPRRSAAAAPGPAGPGTDYRAPGRSGRAGYTGHKATSQDASYALQQSSSRLFVALFDYDPQTMSPNQNAINDELPFTEGQIIKVL